MWCRSARSWAKLRTADHRTHQWRGDALEEPGKAFLACDGHQRVKGGPVSSVWRRVLEPVFHLIQQMVMVALGQSELKQIEKGAKGGTKKGRTYRCQMEIRRRDPRCLQRCQRENRPLGQVCALGRRCRRYISHSTFGINLAAHHFHRLASPKSTSSGWTRWATPAIVFFVPRGGISRLAHPLSSLTSEYTDHLVARQSGDNLHGQQHRFPSCSTVSP